MNAQDIKLTRNGAYYDISFDQNGDFQVIYGMETAIELSFYGKVRASASEVLEVSRRGGWFGNQILYDDYEYGNKLWLLYGSRLTQDIANAAKDYVSNGFVWMIENKIAASVIVDTSVDYSNGTLEIEIIIDAKTYRFTIWLNTNLDNL